MKYLLTFTLIFLYIGLYSQNSFESHIISDNTEGAVSLCATDIDNDDDIDIIGAVYEENLVVCWYNLGNNNDFERITIESGFLEAGSVHADDYNNDGLIDIVAGARLGNKVCVWYNTGDKNNWTKQTLHNSYLYAHEFYSVDIDNDNDIDILGASSSLNEITLWKNNGGDPVDWEEITINSEFGMAKSVTAGDIDNDGDLDIVGAALEDNEIAWWENNNGFETKHIVTSQYSGVHRVQVVDMDNDGNNDILAAAYINNSIAWWRNDGNSPINWEKETIQIGFTDACIAIGFDFNSDSEIEVIGTSQGRNELAIFKKRNESDYQWQKTIIDNVMAAWSLEIVDMDFDGDMDILAASGKGGGNRLVKWYENKTIDVGLNDIFQNNVEIYCQKNELTIDIQYPFNNSEICIYNVLGSTIYKHHNLHYGINKIKLSEFNPGIFIIRMNVDDNVISKKMLLEN